MHLLCAADRACVTFFGQACEEDHIWEGQICAVGHSCSDDFGSRGWIQFSNLQFHRDSVQKRQSYDLPQQHSQFQPLHLTRCTVLSRDTFMQGAQLELEPQTSPLYMDPEIAGPQGETLTCSHFSAPETSCFYITGKNERCHFPPLLTSSSVPKAPS